jgi:murein DD-endopeptidase MepM/ murein hydrolase activator NlpD
MVFGLKKKYFYWFGVLVLACVGWALIPHKSKPTIRKFVEKEARPKLKRDARLLSYHREPQTIDSRTATFYEKLALAGIPGPEIVNLVNSAKPEMDFRRVQRGFQFDLLYSKEIRPVLGTAADAEPTRQFLGIYVPLNAVRSLFIEKKDDGAYAVRVVEEVIERKLKAYAGHVEDSLWMSATNAEMSPLLVAELAEIFAWQVDFAREVRRGDRWRVLIDQGYVGTERLNDARILAAEYINEGEVFQAVFYQRGDSKGYYFPDGSSLRRMFLKSPIKFGRITSRFNRARFHPVLKVRRPHLGVDYGAPTGTPIRAVGDATVTFAAMRGGAGNMITLRHNSVYKTNYMHLSRFAKGIRPGAKVKQGDLIGYVGSTGMSTGPHLHFEMWQNGRYVDPLNVKFPSAEPLPANQLAEFREIAAKFLNSLPAWPKEGVVDVRGTFLAGEADRAIRNIASTFGNE